jgi:hypothetical protein
VKNVARGWTGLVVGSVIIAVTACSGDAAPTRTEYRRDVNAVCRSQRTAIAHLPKPDRSQPDSLIRVGTKMLDLQRSALHQISNLQAPAGDLRASRQWQREVTKVLDLVAASLAAQRRGDLPAATAANASGLLAATRADATARKLGFTACASPPA